MHLIFMLLLILLIILVIIFTVLIYNELIRLRNEVTKNWHIVSDLIDEYVFNSKTIGICSFNKDKTSSKVGIFSPSNKI